MELRRKRAQPSPVKSTSRLQPSEPLHMTTRAASKAASVGSSSRRGSLISNGQLSPTGSFEDSERYPKRRRISTISKTTPTKGSQSSHSASTASRPSTRSMSGGNLPPVAETPTMTKKRKRSSDSTNGSTPISLNFSKNKIARGTDSPPETKKQPARKAKRSSTSSGEGKSSRGGDVIADRRQLELNQANEAHEHGAEVADAELEGRKEVEDFVEHHVDETEDVPADDTTRQSQGSGTDGVNGLLQVKDEARQLKKSQSPNPSEAASNATHGSAEAVNESFNDASVELDDEDAEEEVEVEEEVEEENDVVDVEVLPGEEITTSLEAALSMIDPTPAPSAQASPAGSPPDSSMEQDSPIKRAVASISGDTGIIEDSKGKKKLPGRRRAPHANPKVEAALRRQLHLRMNYRAVAKALKPILAELSHRSLRELNNNPKSHEESSEYPGVKDGLHQQFEQRLAWISRQKELNKRRINDMFEAETQMRKTQYENVTRNMREQHIIRLQHDFLIALRQRDQGEDGHASDDENDDVIPPLRHVTSRGTLSNVLGPEYHWRSRPAIIIEKLFENVYQRHQVIRDRKVHNREPNLESHPFTTFDPTARDSIQASKNLEVLMKALQEAQNVPVVLPPAPIPNHEAHGLLALANASAVNAATDAAMREAEEKARMQDEASAKAKRDQDELKRSSPLSVPKPSLSQPPEETSRNIRTSAPTSNYTPYSESRWSTDTPQPEPDQCQQQQQPQFYESHRPEQQHQHIQPPPPQPPVRPVTTFSQVALNPALTETAPMMHLPGLSQPLPHPIIPGLNYLQNTPSMGAPQTGIPGLGMAQAPMPRNQKSPTPRQSVGQSPTLHRATTRAPSASLANSSPHLSRVQQHQTEQDMYTRPQDLAAPQAQAPEVAPLQSKSTGKDFWSSLATGAKDSGASNSHSFPRDSPSVPPRSEPTPGPIDREFATSYTSDHPPEHQTHPLGDRPLENHPLDVLERHLDRSSEQAQNRPLERPLEVDQDRASFRPPLTASANALEPLSQRLRSTSDSFGSLRGGRDDFDSRKRAPRASMSEAWPRDRQNNQYRHDRRASNMSTVSHDGPNSHSRPSRPSLETSDNRRSPAPARDQWQPPPTPWGDRSPGPMPLPWGNSSPKFMPTPWDDRAPQEVPMPFPSRVTGPPASGPPPPGPPPPGLPPPVSHHYPPVPPPRYGYHQHQSPYTQSPYAAPTGYSSLPGPPPSSQPPPNGYYGAPPPPFQPLQSPYVPPPPPSHLAARSGTSQAPYGQQYGGHPILPAHSGSGPYGGPMGPAHGSPTSNHVGPAFAQYSQRDEARRGGKGRGQAEWKHWQPR